MSAAIPQEAPDALDCRGHASHDRRACADAAAMQWQRGADPLAAASVDDAAARADMAQVLDQALVR